MDVFNTRGEKQPDGTVQVDLRDFGVRDHTGEVDLLPENNPHSVPHYFARELVHSGRARLHVPPAIEIDNGDPVVAHSDPVAQNADPRPKGKKGR